MYVIHLLAHILTFSIYFSRENNHVNLTQDEKNETEEEEEEDINSRDKSDFEKYQIQVDVIENFYSSFMR